MCTHTCTKLMHVPSCTSRSPKTTPPPCNTFPELGYCIVGRPPPPRNTLVREGCTAYGASKVEHTVQCSADHGRRSALVGGSRPRVAQGRARNRELDCNGKGSPPQRLAQPDHATRLAARGELGDGPGREQNTAQQ